MKQVNICLFGVIHAETGRGEYRIRNSEDSRLVLLQQKKYPYEGVVRSVPQDWSNWLKDGEIRYTIDKIEYHESEKTIRAAMVANIEGPGNPCVGTIKANLLRDHPLDDGDTGRHAVLVVGADMANPDPEKHFLVIKNSWGKNWREGGFGVISFNMLSRLCVPKFNRGTNALQHYARTLSSLYKKITDIVRRESATIMAVSPPNNHMSTLRVMKDQVPKVLEKLLVKPSLVNPPPMAEGGLLLYLKMLAMGYDKTQELAKDLRSVGCGDVDIEEEDRFTEFSQQVVTEQPPSENIPINLQEHKSDILIRKNIEDMQDGKSKSHVKVSLYAVC
nr:exocyst complex component SEC10B-like isoform X1 [Tanacetum cinerariifolium]